MKGLNLSKLKKVSSDDKCTVFQHPDGHSVRIAHGSLSPELKKELDKVPMASGGMVKKYAEGTPDEPVYNEYQAEDSAQQPKKDAPVVINVGAQPPQGQQPQQQPAQAAALSVVPQQQPDQAVQSNDSGLAPQSQQSDNATVPTNEYQAESTPQPAQNADASNAAQPEATQAAPKTYQDHYQAALQHYVSEDKAWQNDLNNGHITPKTYADLFANKSTLGKIGMIFGLMAGGAGSGLTGQPNAMLAMMNQQIQNDLDAQTKSKDNARNFVTLNQQHLLNQANVGLVGAQSDIAKTEAKNRAVILSNMQANRAALDIMVKERDKLPLGSPERARADQTLAMASLAADNENLSLASRAAAKEAFLKMNPMGGEQAPSNGPVNYNRMNQLERASQLKLPGAPTPEDISQMTKESSMLEENRTLRNDFNDAFESLNSKFLAGKLSPHDRSSFINSLGGKLAKASAGRYNQQEAVAQVDSMVPQAGDWDETTADKLKNNAKFFDILEAATPTLNRFGLKNAPKPAAAMAAATPQYKIYNGVKYMRGPDGKSAIPVK